jgi:hypothetical protein
MPSIAVGILRQEVDSLVRAIFLLALSDGSLRDNLIAAALSGRQWSMPNAKGKLVKITDRQMVDLADQLNGWTASVYKFGCSFIHLSNFHDHLAIDPFKALPQSERDDIVKHLRAYHGGPRGADPSFGDIVAMVPEVFNKVAGNLECYLGQLERGEALGD